MPDYDTTEKIKKEILPGIYNLPASEYHAADGISNSGLAAIARSPAYYRYGEKKDTDAMRQGRAIHTAVLEPELFRETYALAQGRRNKGAEKIELTALEWETARNVAAAILHHPTCQALLAVGEPEESVFWYDPDTLLLCKGRPDWTCYGEGDNSRPYLLDLKTTKDASPSGFTGAAEHYRYHVQAAFYLDGWHAATGRWIDEFIFVAVEKEPPYAIGLYRLPAWKIEEGRNLYRRDLATYEYCRDRDEWPGYSTDIITLDTWRRYEY
jgi:exodeoxyribonuclease VIII